jgi:hypothetical protein
VFSRNSLLFRSKTIIVFSILFFLTIALVLPQQSSRLKEETGDIPTPDLSFYFGIEDLYGWAESYGKAGRESYIRTRFTFDIIWPLIYTGFLFSSIGGLLYRRGLQDSIVNRFLLLPLGSLVFDYLENISSSIVMWRYPLRTPLVDYAVTVFTPLKWIILGLSFTVFSYSIIRFIYEHALKVKCMRE